MTDDATPPDVVKHLELVQGVIARMSASSGLAKAWCLTVASGAIGYALTKNADEVAAIAIFAVLMFAVLDARYLREERKFRALFDDARLRTVDVFDMNARKYAIPKDPSFRDECAWASVSRSWSLWTFYGPILAAALLVVLVNGRLSDGDAEDAHASPPRHDLSGSPSSSSQEARCGQ